MKTCHPHSSLEQMLCLLWMVWREEVSENASDTTGVGCMSEVHRYLRTPQVSVFVLFVPVTKYFCTSNVSEHLEVGGRRRGLVRRSFLVP